MYACIYIHLFGYVCSLNICYGDAITFVWSGLQRVTEILSLLATQITLLHTMTPQGFLEFRGYLGSSSGFQSAQFRFSFACSSRSSSLFLLFNFWNVCIIVLFDVSVHNFALFFPLPLFHLCNFNCISFIAAGLFVIFYACYVSFLTCVSLLSLTVNVATSDQVDGDQTRRAASAAGHVPEAAIQSGLSAGAGAV